MFEPVSGTDPKVDELEELQATVGEGPGCEALVSGEPVLVDDLASPGSVTRWPVFAPAAVDRGVRGMFSFPAGRGAVHVGVLEVFRDVTGPLSPRDLGDAFAYTDLAMLLVLDSRGGIAASPAESTVRTGDGEAVLHSAEVHQAAGMLSVQLGIPVVDALLRLRARAFAQNVRLTELARSVVAREISFGPNGGSVSDSDLEGSA
ncbi:GAF and ANTAR domain-containing protein [Prauserella flavalba]|uniref:ANTAR domain-containing protein n=1 Tax=Prauserella flavalba TaxID=1477506 RepID=A0A318LHL7_9PSEU|nr:GAF and ANTAR domain-containing protein [Prauserella flavalba]PXY28862.1 hypothetical protein BA062_22350 [Prauserella flavalba]